MFIYRMMKNIKATSLLEKEMKGTWTIEEILEAVKELNEEEREI